MSTTVVSVGVPTSTPGGKYQFSPPKIKASNGTVVSFQFSGSPGNHSVTQSTFASPCTPSVGGFSSGFHSVGPNYNTQWQWPTWSHVVTNDQEPLWFYCAQMDVPPHCEAGMVGVINVQAAAHTFAEFQANAKALASSWSSAAPSSSGSASQSTAGQTAAASSSATGSASASSRPLSSLTSVPASHAPVPVAAVVGGALGALVLLIVGTAAFVLRRRVLRRRRAEPHPLPAMAEAGARPRAASNVPQKRRGLDRASDSERGPERESMLPAILRELRALRRQIGARADQDPPPGYREIPDASKGAEARFVA